MNLKSQIESLLFVSPKPLGAKEIAVLAKADPEAVEQALQELSVAYEAAGSGLAVVMANGRYQLSTSPANAELVKSFLQDETSGELSQPSLEALTIIAYRGPIAKLELDRIRGVNCSLIIRNLLLRGLIEEKFEKTVNEYFYTVTHDFIRWLGLGGIDKLPDYEKFNKLSLEANPAAPASEDVPNIPA